MASETTPLMSDKPLSKEAKAQKAILIIKSLPDDPILSPQRDAILSLLNNLTSNGNAGQSGDTEVKLSNDISPEAREVLEKIASTIVSIHSSAQIKGSNNNNNNNNNNETTIDPLSPSLEMQIIGGVISTLMECIFNKLSQDEGGPIPNTILSFFQDHVTTAMAVAVDVQEDIEEIHKNYQFWVNFMDKYNDRINVELLFNLLNDDKRDESIKILVSCLIEEFGNHIVGSKDEIAANIVEIITEQIRKNAEEEKKSMDFIKLMVLSIAFRILGILITVIGLILTVIAIGIVAICLVFVLFTLCLSIRMRMIFYLSLILFIISWAICRAGFVMFILSMPAAVLGFVEFILRLILTNMFMTKVLLYYDSRDNSFVLESFVQYVVDKMVYLALFVINEIDFTGDVVEQLQQMSSKYTKQDKQE